MFSILHEEPENICLRYAAISIWVEQIKYECQNFLPSESTEMDETSD